MSMCVKERERFSVCCFVSCHNHARAQIVLLSLPFLYVVLIHILYEVFIDGSECFLPILVLQRLSLGAKQ